MTLREIARQAAADGLTAEEASEKYKVNKYSLRKIICRYNMPRLATNPERRVQEQFSKMSDQQLENYGKVLQLPKNSGCSKFEKEMFLLEIRKRGITFAE
jgi:uncharacterized protein YfaT (DUF1175 family)